MINQTILIKYLEYIKDKEVGIDSYEKLINIKEEKLLQEQFMRIFPKIVYEILSYPENNMDFIIFNISSENITLKNTCMFVCEFLNDMKGCEDV